MADVRCPMSDVSLQVLAWPAALAGHQQLTSVCFGNFAEVGLCLDSLLLC